MHCRKRIEPFIVKLEALGIVCTGHTILTTTVELNLHYGGFTECQTVSLGLVAFTVNDDERP